MSSPRPTSKALRPYRYTKKELYNLLPLVYRQRDAELGKPLEAVMGIISEQVRVVEENIDNLYNDWFIETCYPWVVPYIGDLLGARLLNESVGGDTIPERAFVGNTISYRRRKGTVSMLEELSADITGWPAKVVEFFELLETTQYLNHLRPWNFRTPDIRDENCLELLDTPFDKIAHTVEVRHIDNEWGEYNIQNIGIFLYRLEAFPVYGSPAYRVSDGCYRFNVLGLDEPLFNNPVPKTSDFQLAQEVNVPLPIRRTGFFDDVTDYYSSGGVEKSVTVVADNPGVGPNPFTVSSDNVTVYDLSGWWRPPAGSGLIAIDPVLGRLTFASDWHPTNVHVDCYYGFSDEIGGGFYQRPDPDASQITILVGGSPQPTSHIYQIKKGASSPQFGTISAAISYWTGTDGQPPAIFEIEDSEVYPENPSFALPAGILVELRAAQGQRPVVSLTQPLAVSAATVAPNFPLAGLMINGLLLDQDTASQAAISIGQGDLGTLTLRNCTIVPASGASLEIVVSPSVSFSPTSGPVSASVTVQGTGFTPSSNISLTYDGAPLTPPPSIKTGSSGSFKASITLPASSPAGAHVVTVTDGAGNTATSSFVVTSGPVLTLGPPTAPPGGLVVATGTGFQPSSGVSLYFGTSASAPVVGTGATDPTGSFPSEGIKLTIPDSAQFGSNPILATDGTNSVLAYLWISSANDDLAITIDHSITGAIDCSASEAQLQANDSIIDGMGGSAISCYQLTLQECTVFGGVQTFMINLVSDTIFTEAIVSRRRQVGCVRFSYLPPGSRVPRPYKCQPCYPEGATTAQQAALALSVKPTFTSTKYGDPGYAQLSTSGPVQIFRGADNGAEMGAFNELLQALRIDNLSASMNEYLRFGLEAGIFLVT